MTELVRCYILCVNLKGIVIHGHFMYDLLVWQTFLFALPQICVGNVVEFELKIVFVIRVFFEPQQCLFISVWNLNISLHFCLSSIEYDLWRIWYDIFAPVHVVLWYGIFKDGISYGFLRFDFLSFFSEFVFLLHFFDFLIHFVELFLTLLFCLVIHFANYLYKLEGKGIYLPIENCERFCVPIFVSMRFHLH